jgi:hypothetical protein
VPLRADTGIASHRCQAMSFSIAFRASWSVAIVLLASVPGGGGAWAQNVAGDGLAATRVEPAPSEGAFRHLRVLQEIASANGAPAPPARRALIVPRNTWRRG